MTNYAEHHHELGEPAEVTSTPELLVSPDIVAIFGLASVLQPAAGFPEAYVDRVYTINMPSLAAEVTGRTQASVLLDFEAKQRIAARARTIVAAPYVSEISFDLPELARIEAWLDGSIAGKSDEVIAESMGISRRTLNRLSTDIRQHLGASNQASAVYGILLHGHPYGKRRLGAQPPVMTPNRLLHLYLASLGFEEREAVELTKVGPNVSLAQVKSARRQAVRQLGGKVLSQGIVAAYRVGLFRQLDQAMIPRSSKQ